MLLGLETFTVVGLVVGLCLWMALLIGVRRWGSPGGERREVQPEPGKPGEPEPAAVDAESS